MPLLPDGRPEDLDGPGQTQHLDVDVGAALVLRNDEAVRVADSGDALLAADLADVLLVPRPLRVDGHDVEADDVHLGRSRPEDRAGSLAERAAEADGHVLRPLLADRRVLVGVRDGGAVVAGIADAVEVL